MRCRRLLLLPLVAAAAAGPAFAAGGSASRFETTLFAQRASRDGDRTDVSGMEFRWTGRWTHLSVSVVLPWVRLEGSGTIVRVGDGWVSAPGGPPTGSGGGAGSGAGNGGSGAGPGGPAEAAVLDPAEAPAETRFGASGVGDARVGAALRLGRDRVAGSWSLHGGVKLPTADESRALGTGELDAWAGVTWLREGWHADLEMWAEWCALGDPPGYDLEDGPAGGMLVSWPVGRVEMAAGADAGSAVYLGAPSRRSALLVVRGPASRRTVWEVEARAGLSEASPDFGVAVGIGF